MGLKSPIILWTLATFPTSHLFASLSSPNFDVFSSIYWISCSRADASQFQFTLGTFTYCLANCPLLCLHLSNCFLAYNSQLRQCLLQEAFLALFLLTRSSHRILNFLSIANITHDLNHLLASPSQMHNPWEDGPGPVCHRIQCLAQCLAQASGHSHQPHTHRASPELSLSPLALKVTRVLLKEPANSSFPGIPPRHMNCIFLFPQY